MSIRRILVPLDGSELAEHALGFATDLARRSNASLHLLSVVPDPFVLDPGAVPAPIAFHIAREHIAVERYMDTLVARLEQSPDLRITSEVALGAPVDSILTTIRRTNADLLVMTSHGRGGFTRFWLGSVADALMRRSPIPILVLKPDGRKEAAETRPGLSGILVPLDGSPLAETAIEPAIALANVLRIPITLLLVLENPLDIAPGFAPYTLQYEPVVPFEQREHARRYLDAVADRVRKHGVLVDVALSDRIGVATAIIEYEREHVQGVIAMATNGRGGWKRLVTGSIADKVFRQADCPVLLIRPLDAPPRPMPDRHQAWQHELSAFTNRNASRPVLIEIDVPALGAQREVEGLELSGVYYDPRDDRFGVTVHGRGLTHLTHTIASPVGVDVLDDAGGETLAVRHDGGLTLIRCMVPDSGRPARIDDQMAAMQ